MRKGLTTIAVLFLATASLQGCLLIPFVDSFKKSGITEGDRQALLSPDIKRFGDNLSAGTIAGALTYAKPESRSTLSEQFENVGEKEKIVDLKVTSIDFTDDSFKAAANVAVRYYRIPYYVVQTRKERHDWEFSLGSGWKIARRTIKEESKG